jgi:hypothetical protein
MVITFAFLQKCFKSLLMLCHLGLHSTRVEKEKQMRAALIMFVTQSTADANSF